jgi:adenylate cyclase
MTEQGVTQRLAAILAADVAGYTRLMADDAPATIAALTGCRTVFRQCIETNGGRVVDMAGDSVLAVFASTAGAVRAAADAQGEIAGRNEALDEARRMRFRIGINLGDIHEAADGTVYGDGVNVAARFEGLALPGGVMLSEDAWRQVRGDGERSFVDAGEHTVKNVAEPVHAYRLEVAGEAAPEMQAAERSSIAVLPFDNMSRDEDQEYFSDGITEDIITALSRYRWLTVIARNSTFTYKGKAVDVAQVGRELGVRYVLEGSVRRAGSRVRVTAQLIEAEGAGHIWAERYDRELDDIFALQDEITETIVLAIEPKLGAAERQRAHAKRTGDLNAWDAYQQGLWHLYRHTVDDHAAARALFERAIAMDPAFAPAHAALAMTDIWAVMFAYTDDIPAAIAAATAAANASLALDDRDADAHLILGRIGLLTGDHTQILEESETALALNPSLALGHLVRGQALAFSGDYDSALADFELGIRLSPHDPQIWAFEGWAGLAQLLLGDVEVANDWMRKAVRRPTVQPLIHLFHACTLAHLDRLDEAKAAMARLTALQPGFTLAALSAAYPNAPDDMKTVLYGGLRKIGVEIPDEL